MNKKKTDNSKTNARRKDANVGRPDAKANRQSSNARRPDTNTGQLRMTRQRRIILEELQTPGGHFTADEIYSKIRKRLPNISLGTVYRNLDVLTKTGKIKKLSLGNGPKQYDGGMHRHYHARCIKCSKVCDVSSDAFGDLNIAAAVGVAGFDIIDHELEFTGLCDECKKNMTKL